MTICFKKNLICFVIFMTLKLQIQYISIHCEDSNFQYNVKIRYAFIDFAALNEMQKYTLDFLYTLLNKK